MVPPGIPGELYIGGAGLARGYLCNPQQTANYFIPHPYSQKAGERLYRTGDRVRSRENGQLEFIGRIDDQVKIRNYRIELGEIEATLEQHPGVREAAIMIRNYGSGDSRILAYVVLIQHETAAVPTVEQLYQFLREHLPEYMLPSAILLLDSLPLNASGKVDRLALPLPSIDDIKQKNPRVAPKNEIEKTIAEVWKEVLRQDFISIHDNFFDLGGHSLLLLQIHSKLRRTLQREIALVDLFKCPTISSLAVYLAQQEIAMPAESLRKDPVKLETRKSMIKHQRTARKQYRSRLSEDMTERE
jgi:acyl carrier protein